VCSEQINLEAGPAATALVPAATLHLLCEDLPVFTWWRRALVTDEPLLLPLAEISDRFIVDTASHDDPRSALATLQSLAADRSWKGNTGDLAWARLEPWREILAAFFDSPLTRDHLRRITSVSISAGGPVSEKEYTAAAGYLAGWFGSRLGWTRDEKANGWRRPDGVAVATDLTHDPQIEAGEIASVRIEAKDADPPASFVAERLSPYRPLVRLTVEIEGTCPLPRILTLGLLEEVALLCDELERDANDPVFEAALRTAVALAGGTV
jgi:glucose-6-phosphate dehydrogenase assembly protein OpcA